MKLLINQDVKKENWIKLLNKSQFVSPFQSPEFYKLYNEIDIFLSDVFAIEENGEYKALVVVTIQKERGIKGFFSKRGIIYGGPLLISLDVDILDRLLKGLKKNYKKGIIYLEIRNNFDYSFFDNIFEKNGWIYEKRLNIELDIKNKSSEDILSKMKYNRRRQIKRS